LELDEVKDPILKETDFGAIHHEDNNLKLHGLDSARDKHFKNRRLTSKAMIYLNLPYVAIP
jgi:hypothetical protein